MQRTATGDQVGSSSSVGVVVLLDVVGAVVVVTSSAALPGVQDAAAMSAAISTGPRIALAAARIGPGRRRLAADPPTDGGSAFAPKLLRARALAGRREGGVALRLDQ